MRIEWSSLNDVISLSCPLLLFWHLTSELGPWTNMKTSILDYLLKSKALVMPYILGSFLGIKSTYCRVEDIIVFMPLTSSDFCSSWFFRIRNCVMLVTGVKTLKTNLAWTGGRRCLRPRLRSVFYLPKTAFALNKPAVFLVPVFHWWFNQKAI